MSRIGRAPITIPSGVDVKLVDGIITVKGPKGTLTRDINSIIKCEVNNGKIVFTRPNEDKETRAKHGLYRALVNNMVHGVTHGYDKALVINGIGYKAQVVGNKLVLNIGYSHPVEFVAPAGITFTCPSITDIVVSGVDKELVGQVAANIKASRVIEPYHAYGVRYKTDVVVIKEGKKAGK
ncbi:MAG: 50S ribosomal protein L6 [Clostridia bacterium]|nr:50S ribosomal protein L6 [Clostridia bacterium]